MANYKGHLGGGLTGGLCFVFATTFLPVEWATKTNGILSSWQMLAIIFVVAMLFALWPDVDTNSKAQDIFFGLAFICDILLIYFGRFEAAAYLGLLAMTPIVSKHRGWTHSKIAMALVPLPILLLPWLQDAQNLLPAILFYGAAVSGYFSHLLLDGLIWRKIRIKAGWHN